MTASDQVHVDVARDELVGVTNLANLLAPLVVALCGNSPVHSLLSGGGSLPQMLGAERGVCSAREASMGAIEPEAHRHGMPAAPHADLGAWVTDVAAMRFLHVANAAYAAVDGDEHLPPGYGLASSPPPAARARAGRPNAAGGGGRRGGRADWARFERHEHYVWHSARPRCRTRTVELRAACQGPWRGGSAGGGDDGAHMALSARPRPVEGARDLGGVARGAHRSTSGGPRCAVAHAHDRARPARRRRRRHGSAPPPLPAGVGWGELVGATLGAGGRARSAPARRGGAARAGARARPRAGPHAAQDAAAAGGLMALIEHTRSSLRVDRDYDQHHRRTGRTRNEAHYPARCLISKQIFALDPSPSPSPAAVHGSRTPRLQSSSRA